MTEPFLQASNSTPASTPQPQLQRRLGILNATSINMSNMIGIGPFITVPPILATMGGPQALISWFVGALLAICDGLVVPNSALLYLERADLICSCATPSVASAGAN